jgi:hypothetical protein
VSRSEGKHETRFIQIHALLRGKTLLLLVYIAMSVKGVGLSPFTWSCVGCPTSTHKSNACQLLIFVASNSGESFLVKGVEKKTLATPPLVVVADIMRVREHTREARNFIDKRKKKKWRFCPNLLHMTRQCSRW